MQDPGVPTGGEGVRRASCYVPGQKRRSTARSGRDELLVGERTGQMVGKPRVSSFVNSPSVRKPQVTTNGQTAAPGMDGAMAVGATAHTRKEYSGPLPHKQQPLPQEEGRQRVVGRDLDVLEEIGRGSHGVVFKARCRRSRRLYCIKKMRKTADSTENETAAREAC